MKLSKFENGDTVICIKECRDCAYGEGAITEGSICKIRESERQNFYGVYTLVEAYNKDKKLRTFYISVTEANHCFERYIKSNNNPKINKEDLSDSEKISYIFDMCESIMKDIEDLKQKI